MIKNRMVGATLLIAGTAIGAGTLALPVSTGVFGFYPAVFIFILAWAYMAYTGLLIMEANLWTPEDTNIISMAHKTLGRPGEIVAWIAYILLLFSILSAYTSGLGSLCHDVMRSLDLEVASWTGALFFVVLCGLMIFEGKRWVDSVNRILMVGLGLVFLALIFNLFPHVDAALLTSHKPSMIYKALPIVVTAFGYHIVIPSLRTYLHGDVKKLRRAIIIGSTLPVFVYIIWEILVVVILPATGTGGLCDILRSGSPEVGQPQRLLETTVPVESYKLNQPLSQ